MSDEILGAIAAVRAALAEPPRCPVCGAATREQYHPPDGPDRECWTYHCADEAQVDGSGCGYEWGLGGELIGRVRAEDGIPVPLRVAVTALIARLVAPDAADGDGGRP